MGLEDAKNEVDRAFTGGGTGLAYENAFGGALSAFRRRYAKDYGAHDLVLMGVPFDQAVTNRPGTRLGPRAIREASTLQPFDAPYGWGYSPFEEMDVIDGGDLAFDYADVPAFPPRLTAHVAEILKSGPGTIAMGGDHSISLPILKAYAEAFGPISLIQFDAHSDTWPDDNMARIDHGTMFYKAVKLGIIDPASSVQVGIRTDNPDTLGIRIIDAPQVHRSAPEEVAARIRETVGTRPCYLTFDIDALDPAFAPGTGTPVWGGLASWQVAAILRGLAGIDLKGGDVVEVSPPFDTTGATAIAAAHVMMELICLYGWNRNERA